MNIEGTAKNIMSAAENHATLLTFIGTGLARAAEDVPTDPLGRLAHYLNVTDPLGGPIYELKHDFSSVANLKWKLIDSPHLNTALFKASAAVAIAGRFLDIVPQRYVKLAEKVAVGALASALVFPGSGPNDPLGKQALAREAMLKSTNPTPGGNYLSASTGRLIGN